MAAEQPPSPLAVSRSRRANAGAKMNQLINQQEKDKATDEFYATTYGGFVEEEDDYDYEAKSEDEDIVDSDFDVELSDDNGEEEPEGDNGFSNRKRRRDIVEDDEEEEDRIKRRKALKRKRLSMQNITPGTEKPKKQKKLVENLSESADLNNKQTEENEDSLETGGNVDRKRSALRHSTQKRSELGEERRAKERAKWEQNKEVRDKRKAKRAQRRRKLTQEELLEEAKFTERRNIESLERFRKFEELKKEAHRTVKQRKINTHGCVKFTSFTMHDHIGGEDVPFAHNFISFGDKHLFKETFRGFSHSSRPLAAATRKICPLTGQTARYFDPVTQLPYANLQAFKMLRQIHADASKRGGRSGGDVAL